MSELWRWVAAQPHVRHVPLFETNSSGTVATHLIGLEKNRRVLKRSACMEDSIIDTVESGLAETGWLGILYMMGWGPKERFRPLYIGKAGKAGKKPGVISANLVKLRRDKNKFARWGDGATAYHIGSLSTVLFTDRDFSVRPKYERWAEMLFKSVEPPVLRKETHLLIIPWRQGGLTPTGHPMTLEQLEETLIEIALDEFDDVVLNVRGETWWSQGARALKTPAKTLAPQLPVSIIEHRDDLAELCYVLANKECLALDVETEWRSQRLCLIQIGTRTRSYLIDPIALNGDIEPLASLLGNPVITKVIHNAAFEKRVMESVGINITNIYDTYRAAERVYGRRKGRNKLSPICERLLGLPMDKAEQRSPWDRRPLTQKQRNYAALDVEVLLPIFDRLAGLDPEHPSKGLF